MEAERTSTPGGRLLLVEDDPVALDLLAEVMRREGHQVTTAQNAAAALALAETTHPDVVVTDIRLGGMDGLTLLQQLQSAVPSAQVVVVTAYGTLETAIQAVKAGAFDYLSKPFGMDEIVRITRRALESRAEPGDDRAASPSGVALIGRCPAMTDVFKAIGRIAPLDTSVLVLGETGTGKELVARAIHDASERARGPYVALNCPSLPEGLLESELFGHRRGAFTGATSDHLGLFRAAHGGTILLDEIGDMPLAVQAKLLRVLESREVRPVGATESLPVDVRVLAATHQDLELAVEAERFRSDLLYRLNAVTIRIPPLRERLEDLPLLIEALLDRLGRGGRGRSFSDLTPEVLEAFQRYPWPGNIRELLHVLERATALGRGPRVELDDLPEGFRAPARGAERSADLSLRGVEREHILAVLRTVEGHRSQAAALLGIDRKTLYRKLREYGLPEEGPK